MENASCAKNTLDTSINAHVQWVCVCVCVRVSGATRRLKCAFYELCTHCILCVCTTFLLCILEIRSQSIFRILLSLFGWFYYCYYYSNAAHNNHFITLLIVQRLKWKLKTNGTLLHLFHHFIHSGRAFAPREWRWCILVRSSEPTWCGEKSQRNVTGSRYVSEYRKANKKNTDSLSHDDEWMHSVGAAQRGKSVRSHSIIGVRFTSRNGTVLCSQHLPFSGQFSHLFIFTFFSVFQSEFRLSRSCEGSVLRIYDFATMIYAHNVHLERKRCEACNFEYPKTNPEANEILFSFYLRLFRSGAGLSALPLHAPVFVLLFHLSTQMQI